MSNAPDPSVVLDHIAVAVPDGAEVGHLLGETLGGRSAKAGPGRGFRFWQWEYANRGRLEILRPDGPPGGFLHRFLERRGAGFHHVTFKVQDLESATDRATEAGYDVVGMDLSDPSWKEAFLHPRQAGGIVVQFAEEHDDPEALDRSNLTGRRDRARLAVDLVGLRMAARKPASARALWEKLLKARCREQGDLLLFHWPESPLRIAVQIEPDAPEGAVAVEVSASHPIEIPETPDPVLGVRFIRVSQEPVAGNRPS